MKLVLKMVATDADSEQYGRVTYRLSGGEGVFSISEDGWILVSGEVDREKVSVFNNYHYYQNYSFCIISWFFFLIFVFFKAIKYLWILFFSLQLSFQLHNFLVPCLFSSQLIDYMLLLPMVVLLHLLRRLK